MSASQAECRGFESHRPLQSFWLQKSCCCVISFQEVGFARFFYFLWCKMDRSSLSYREKIIELVEPVVESGEMELIDVECFRGKSSWMVRIYIDKESGVGLDDCAMISGEIGDLLDINETPPGAYDLEVSSPGLDRPLVRDKDFIRYAGHKVRIRIAGKIEGGKNFRGRLVKFIEKEGEKIIVINVEGKVYNIPRSMIVKANLQYEF